MTVAIALQVHDGVVLASDSALTLNNTTKTAPDNILNIYNNANKIFNLKKGLPIGGVTYGMGSFGASSITTLIKDLRRRFSGDDKDYQAWAIGISYTVEQIAIKTREFLFEENFLPLNATSSGVQFGFLVAGYGAGAKLSETWSIEIKDGKCEPPKLVIPQGQSNCIVGGDPEVFCRLANGVSPFLAPVLLHAGFDQLTVDKVVAAAQSGLGIPLVEAPMPIQDAIDLAEFFVSTTSIFARFKRGAATVGGPVESAAITKHEGFKWVHRKHYFSTELNPRGT
jgi:hypothetical protein